MEEKRKMGTDWKTLYDAHETEPEALPEAPEPPGQLVYNETIISHFRNPRHVGDMENPDGTATVGDPSCGDFIQIFLKFNHETIADLRYLVYGCPAAIATTSILSELAVGKTLDDALLLTDDDVIEAAGGIPANKAHCSLLGVVGLHTAIADYLSRKERNAP